jgi:hypothetical protein
MIDPTYHIENPFCWKRSPDKYLFYEARRSPNPGAAMELYRKITGYSQQHFDTFWKEFIEYLIWYGHPFDTKVIAAQANGWWFYSICDGYGQHGPKFLLMDEWIFLLDNRKRRKAGGEKELIA